MIFISPTKFRAIFDDFFLKLLKKKLTFLPIAQFEINIDHCVVVVVRPHILQCM